MPHTFRCALPSRRGTTLRLGDHRVAIGHDGTCEVPDGRQGWFMAQPRVWQPIAAQPAETAHQADDQPMPGEGHDDVTPSPARRKGRKGRRF